MKPVFEFTKGMREMTTSYCPGCTHGIAHRLIMEVLEEKGALGNAIGVSPVGCSIVAHQFMNVDMMESPHGRRPQAWKAVLWSRQESRCVFPKCWRPSTVLFTWNVFPSTPLQKCGRRKKPFELPLKYRKRSWVLPS